MPEGNIPQNLPLAKQPNVSSVKSVQKSKLPPELPPAGEPKGDPEFPYGSFSKDNPSDEVLVPVQHGSKPRLAQKKYQKLSGARIIIIIAILVGVSAAAYFVYNAVSSNMSEDNPLNIEQQNVVKTETIIDTDSDGLDDKREAELGTNPNKKDTDNDGYEDGVEVRNGFNPLGEGQAK